jgi:hypothetical protein
MTETEYARKLDELDRLLNDPDVPIEPSRIWSLLAEISAETSIADDISPNIFQLAAWTNLIMGDSPDGEKCDSRLTSASEVRLGTRFDDG